MQATLFDTDTTIDRYAAEGGSMLWHERCTALLSHDWMRWGEPPLTYSHHESLYTALEHLWQCEVIERKVEPVEDEWGRNQGWRIYFRLKASS